MTISVNVEPVFEVLPDTAFAFINELQNDAVYYCPVCGSALMYLKVSRRLEGEAMVYDLSLHCAICKHDAGGGPTGCDYITVDVPDIDDMEGMK